MKERMKGALVQSEMQAAKQSYTKKAMPNHAGQARAKAARLKLRKG